MKAILVVDLPNDIFVDDCRIEFRVIENVMNMCVEDGIKRLKPLPQRKEELYYPCNEYIQAVNEGYNDCIDEILGEE